MKNESPGVLTNTPELQKQLTQFAMDNVSIEIYWVGIDAGIFYANNQACKTLGYDKQELLRLTISDLDPNYPIKLWSEHFQQLKRDKTQSFETIHKRKDGSLFPVEVIANYVFFEGQEYNVGFAKDITERKNAEETLRKSEQKFRTVFDSSCDMLMMLDENGFFDANKAALAESGCASVEEFCLLSPAALAPDYQSNGISTKQLASEYIATAFEKGFHRFEWMNKRINGEVFPSEVTLTAMQQDEKRFLLVTTRNITERKLAEEALHEQEEFFRTISENVDDYIAVLDLEGKRIYNNPSYANLFGDLMAIKGSDCFAEIHPEDREHIKETFNETIKNGISNRSEYRFVIPGGNIRNMESRGWLIKDTLGQPLRVIVVSHDITERKISESNIHDMAFHDSLTQLPNRRLLDDRLEHAIATSKRSGHFGAVMFLDLDNFKPLNDNYGHKAGDLLLIEVARRLEGCMREVDTVARFGGDEFVVVVSELEGDENECKEQARNLAEKIRVALAGTYWLGSNISGTSKMIVHNNVEVSIGVSLFKNNSDAERVLKYADKAMYKAKQSGRNNICFYE
jgi:diguanylate cyclase (GGDEF)-like protein/PAS domain S-box-containing protein